MEDPLLFLAPDVLKGEGSNGLLARGAATMVPKLKNRKAQNLIEYAIVVALISAAVAALSTYVFRSIQAQQKIITEESAN